MQIKTIIVYFVKFLKDFIIYNDLKEKSNEIQKEYALNDRTYYSYYYWNKEQFLIYHEKKETEIEN
jgi:hypothetical protein